MNWLVQHVNDLYLFKQTLEREKDKFNIDLFFEISWFEEIFAEFKWA